MKPSPSLFFSAHLSDQFDDSPILFREIQFLGLWCTYTYACGCMGKISNIELLKLF